MKRAVILAAALTGAACGSDDEGQNTALMPPGGVLLTYVAGTDESGACQPARMDRADAGASGLIAVRGESVFAMPTGETRIPFQSVHRYPDDKGISTDQSTTLLNEAGACEDLVITVTIDHCEYDAEGGREERACPPIVVSGTDGFASVKVIREDR